MRRSIAIITFCVAACHQVFAQDTCAVQPPTNVVVDDSICIDPSYLDNALPRLSDFRDIHRNPSLTKMQKLQEYGNFFVRVIDAFDNIDTSYVQRNRYNFTVMLQGTHSYEYYLIGSGNFEQRISFSQHPDLRIGPYFGWKWLFLGYTFDVTHLGSTRQQAARFDLSIYTSMIGIDLMYRQTGTDFYINDIHGWGDNAAAFKGTDCNYIRTSMMGLNLYYLFNHRKFSNPAVYSQSTIQRRSAGSWQIGASYSRHDVQFDYTALPDGMLSANEDDNQLTALERVKYSNYSVNFGYAYNYVFARNWCLGVSVMPGLGYKWFSAETAVMANEKETQTQQGHGFRAKLDEIFHRRGNVNIDGTARGGFIYNNGRWFAGMVGVMRLYNCKRDDMRFTNVFGTANLYVGFYFQKKRSYKTGRRTRSIVEIP